MQSAMLYLETALILAILAFLSTLVGIWIFITFFEKDEVPKFPQILQEGDCAQDFYVENVRRKLLERSQAGIRKYNTNLERKDFSTLNWLHHAQEEALDFANYLEVLIHRAEKSGD